MSSRRPEWWLLFQQRSGWSLQNTIVKRRHKLATWPLFCRRSIPGKKLSKNNCDSKSLCPRGRESTSAERCPRASNLKSYLQTKHAVQIGTTNSNWGHFVSTLRRTAQGAAPFCKFRQKCAQTKPQTFVGIGYLESQVTLLLRGRCRTKCPPGAGGAGGPGGPWPARHGNRTSGPGEGSPSGARTPRCRCHSYSRPAACGSRLGHRSRRPLAVETIGKWRHVRHTPRDFKDHQIWNSCGSTGRENPRLLWKMARFETTVARVGAKGRERAGRRRRGREKTRSPPSKFEPRLTFWNISGNTWKTKQTNHNNNKKHKKRPKFKWRHHATGKERPRVAARLESLGVGEGKQATAGHFCQRTKTLRNIPPPCTNSHKARIGRGLLPRATACRRGTASWWVPPTGASCNPATCPQTSWTGPRPRRRRCPRCVSAAVLWAGRWRSQLRSPRRLPCPEPAHTARQRPRAECSR